MTLSFTIPNTIWFIILCVAVCLIGYKWFIAMGWITKPKLATKSEPIPTISDGDKDPLDMSCDKRTTKWDVNDCCPKCRVKVSFNEYMDNICNACGYMGTLCHDGRMDRKIKIGDKWHHQVVIRGSKETYINGKLYGRIST